MSDNEPIDPALAALFHDEPKPAPPEGAQARVASRLLVAIPVMRPGGAGQAAIGHAMSAKVAGALAATFVAGGVVGGVAVTVLRPAPPARVVYVDRPAPAVPTPAPAPSTASSATGVPPPAPSAAPETKPVPSSDRDELAAERQLVDDARARLSSGDPGGALVRLQDHARRYPRGRLAEEREALAVEALVQAGRYDDARARGAQFHARWPGSVMMPAVDATLGSIP